MNVTTNMSHQRAVRLQRNTITRQSRRSRTAHDDIIYWLGSLRYVPEVDEIITRWGVSRATAFRHRAFALRKCYDR